MSDVPNRRMPLSPWPFVGLGGLACLGFLYGGSLIFLPWWTVAILYVLWLPLMVTGSRWFAERPKGVVWLAATGVAAWLLAVLVAAAAA